MTRSTPPRTAKPSDKPSPGYAESQTERESLGQGDTRPRDRGAARIDRQDPGSERAADPDDAARGQRSGASEHGRRTAGDPRDEGDAET